MKTKIVTIVFCLLLLWVIVELLIEGTASPTGRVFADLGFGVQTGVIGFVYSTILTKPGMLLGGWADFLHRHFTLFHVKQSMNKGWSPGYMEDKLQQNSWWLKPVLTCCWCVSGQIALWLFIPFAWSHWSLNGHLAAVSMSILTGGLLEHFLKHIVWKK